MSPLEQRQRALQAANAVRKEQAEIRRAIHGLSHHDGLKHAASLLGDERRAVQSMTVGKLIRPVRKIGDTKLRRMLNAAGIPSEDTRVGKLTRRQRDALGLLLSNGGRKPRPQRLCYRCSEPLPKGRVVWCSDSCCSIAARQRERAAA